MRIGLVLRVLAAVVGVAMFGVAARYAVVRQIDVRPDLWVRWWVTAAVVHDTLVAPAAVAVGWAVVRFAPRPLKAPAQAGLILSAVLVLASWPALRGYGRIASNHTYLPRQYGTGLIATLLVVWAACAAWTVARWVGQVRRQPAR